MAVTIPTLDEIRAVVQEAIASQVPAPGTPKLMKLKTAADHFDVGVRTLRRMAEEGEITLYQRQAAQGSECRVDPDEVRAALTKVAGVK